MIIVRAIRRHKINQVHLIMEVISPLHMNLEQKKIWDRILSKVYNKMIDNPIYNDYTFNEFSRVFDCVVKYKYYEIQNKLHYQKRI